MRDRILRGQATERTSRRMPVQLLANTDMAATRAVQVDAAVRLVRTLSQRERALAVVAAADETAEREVERGLGAELLRIKQEVGALVAEQHAAHGPANEAGGLCGT